MARAIVSTTRLIMEVANKREELQVEEEVDDDKLRSCRGCLSVKILETAFQAWLRMGKSLNLRWMDENESISYRCICGLAWLSLA